MWIYYRTLLLTVVCATVTAQTCTRLLHSNGHLYNMSHDSKILHFKCHVTLLLPQGWDHFSLPLCLVLELLDCQLASSTCQIGTHYGLVWMESQLVSSDYLIKTRNWGSFLVSWGFHHVLSNWEFVVYVFMLYSGAWWGHICYQKQHNQTDILFFLCTCLALHSNYCMGCDDAF